MVAFVVALTVPLGLSTVAITSRTLDRADVAAVASDWAAAHGWRIVVVDSTDEGIEVQVAGEPPGPDQAAFRRRLDESGSRTSTSSSS